MIKSITFKLLPLTNSKRERLFKMVENFQLIYNMTAERLPSLQLLKIPEGLWVGSGFLKVKLPYGKSAIFNELRKEMNNKIIVHSKIAEEAIKYARANYQTIITSGQAVKTILTVPIVRFHNQIWSFKNKNNRTYVVVPCEKIGKRYKNIWLPIKDTDYYSDIINNNHIFGVGQINIDTGTFITSIEVSSSKKLEYIPQTFIGIDMGKNNLAVAVVLDKNGFKESKFWNGKENRHIRKSFDTYRNAVAKIGRTDLLEESDKYEHNWMKNTNHNISKEIVKLSSKYPNPIIVMEDLHRFGNYKWNFYQLRQMVEYKAEIKHIKTTLVNPRYTSQTCPKCNYIDKNNRNGINFKCIKCSYQNNADFVGAWNIARKSGIIQRKEV